MLLFNIKTLAGASKISRTISKGEDMAHLPQIHNAWLLTKGDRIADFGTMDSCPTAQQYKGIWVDCSGKMVLPCWCDSHTHIVFAAYREEEFIDKVQGMTYEEIASKGGGILNSARRLAEASEEELFQSAWTRLQDMIRLGTGAIEIKSGYGLSTESELKMLRVIKRLKAESPIPIKATFLGAHSLPQAYKHDRAAYIRLIINEMMPAIAKENLADYCDVFCERGFFTPEETTEILQAGLRHGMKPKIHANQLDYSGGVQVGVANGAISVDHLEHCGEAEIAALQGSETMPTLLPSCAFFIHLPFPPARALIAAGLPVVLATDYNPGSTPSGNMQFVISLASIKMKMLPEEAINAATINGAHAMELEHLVGSIEPGKLANVIITKPIPSLAYIPYAFGENVVERVVINGKLLGKSP